MENNNNSMDEQYGNAPKVTVDNVALVDRKYLSESSFNRLNDDEKAKARELARTVDFNDETTVYNFGVETQQKLGSGADRILNAITSDKADKAGIGLTAFVKTMKENSYEPSMLEKFAMNLPIIGDMIKKAQIKKIANDTIAQSLNSVSAVLETNKVALIQDNGINRALKEENKTYLRENEINIAAIELVMKDLKENLIPLKEKELSGDQTNPFLLDELNELKSKLNTFDKKQHQLKMSSMIAFQAIPRIDMTINANKNLVDQIINAHVNILPVWKAQIAEGLMLDRQRKSSEIMRSFNDTTNQMILQNSKNFKENSLLIARENERGNIDIETIRQTSRDFVETFEGIKKIAEEGTKQRRIDAKELETIRKGIVDDIRKLSIETSNDTIDVSYTEVERKALK